MSDNRIIRNEFAGAIVTDAGAVNGRFFNVVADMESGRILNQRFTTKSRPISGYGGGAKLRAELRFDDECGNGHETFAITGEIRIPGLRDCEACGCLHDDIARVFPELAPLIRWHLVSTDGPLHYVANTVYLAGDRDFHGKRAGEPRAWDREVQFGANPIKHKLRTAFAKFLEEDRSGFDFEVIRVDHRDRGKTGKYQFGPKFTFGGCGKDWHECPFDDESAAIDFLTALQTCRPQFVSIPTQWSEGKARELNAARGAAVWPDATDAQLMAEPADLRAALEARLPALLAEFRADIERAGFWYAIPDKAV